MNVHPHYITPNGEVKTAMQVRLEYGHEKTLGYAWEMPEWLKDKNYKPHDEPQADLNTQRLLHEAQETIKKMESELSDLRSKIISERAQYIQIISERELLIKSYSEFTDTTLANIQTMIDNLKRP